MHNYCKTATNNAWASKPTSSFKNLKSFHFITMR